MSKNLGRINDIITQLERQHKVSVQNINEGIKLNALCNALQLEHSQFDNLIFHNSPVMRTVKGHVFESYFDELMVTVTEEVVRVGGDDAIDRIVRGNTLQLKTPYKAGTKGTIVSYKTHKTHGAKSEKESLDYYHDTKHFAEFLVGLISYIPLNILILKKSEFPRHQKDCNKILSPFKIDWASHPGLNAWDRLGIKKTPPNNNILPNSNEKLPQTSHFLGVNTNLILNTILSSENFRIWDMSIRGFAREVVFIKELEDRGIDIIPPSHTGRERADKSDHAVRSKSDKKYYFFQMKGASVNNCRFDGKDSIVATETQLTRGRVNDHPTQSRLYLASDFDYLVIGLDPSLTQEFDIEICRKNIRYEWQFFCIPTNSLERHHTIKRRLKSLQSFRYLDLKKYKIDDYWFNLWSQKIITTDTVQDEQPQNL
jgi:hypothetical protein